MTEFDRRGPYKNSENWVLSQIVWSKYFLNKLFVPLIKEVFLHNFRQFQHGYKNSEFQIVWRKYFLDKLFDKEVKFFNWIFDGNRRGPYKNSENLVLSQIVLRKYILAKLFVPFIKRSVSPQFQALFGNLNFWRNSTGATLQK